MNKDDRDWLKEAMKDWIDHQDPSKETMRMFDDIKESLTELKSEMKEGFNKAEKQYANKWVEQTLKGGVGAILLYFLGGMLGLFSIPLAHSSLAYIIKLLA